MIEAYLEQGKSVLGNVVYEGRCWAFEFRYYGYVSYNHPDPASLHVEGESESNKNEVHPVVRKKTRIYEPYTRELVTILCLPGYPKSGQGKDDLEYANLVSMKNRPREVFLGRFCLLWTLVCALVPVYILRQMRIIDEAEYYAGIKDDYENVHKGWIIYWLFIGVGVFVFAFGGNGLAWLYRRWWLLHSGSISQGDLSVHGVELGATSESRSGEEYHRMRNS